MVRMLWFGVVALGCALSGLAAVEVDHAEGRLRCRWPGEQAPALRSIEQNTTQGPITLQCLHGDHEGRGYLIAWHDQPPLATHTPAEVADLLAAGARALAKRLGGELTHSQPGVWAGQPAIALTITISADPETDRQARVAVGRLVMAGRRVYQQVCLGAPNEAAPAVQAAAADFLASFALPADPVPAQSPAGVPSPASPAAASSP